MVKLGLSNPRVFLGLSLLLLLPILSDCNNHNMVSGSVRSIAIDSHEGTAKSVRVSLKNDDTPDAHYDFVVRDRDFSTFWRSPDSEKALRPGETRELTLIPEAAVRPYIGDVVEVFAVRQDTGVESFIGAYVVSGKTRSVINPDFAMWHQDGLLPLAWQPSVQDPHATVDYVKVSEGGRAGVRMTLSSSQTAIWHVSSLNQRIEKEAVVHASIYPLADCDGWRPQPWSILGLRMFDELGNALVFCISPHVKKSETHQFNAGHQLVVVLPGRLNAWNRIEADPSRYFGFVRLRGDADGLVSVGPYLAIRPTMREQSIKVSAVFGEVTTVGRSRAATLPGGATARIKTALKE